MCAVGGGCDIVCRPASEEGGGTGVRGGGSGALCSRAVRVRDGNRAGEEGTGEGGIDVRNIAFSLVSSCSLNLNPCIRFEIFESPDLMPLFSAWRPNIISVAFLVGGSSIGDQLATEASTTAKNDIGIDHGAVEESSGMTRYHLVTLTHE